MPMPCFLTVTGDTQGNIEGSCKIQGHEGKILVQAVDHVIAIPTSPQNGMPTGKRVHEPLEITKEIDKSSPKLMQALTSGEKLKNVMLEYVHISDKGQEEVYYTVELQGAISTKMQKSTPICLQDQNKKMGHMETLAFSYEKIVETHKTDGIEAEDSWLAPKANA